MSHDQPWERQPGESNRSFQAFTVYRDAGPERSLRATADVLRAAERTVKEWSSKHSWATRVAAWDTHMDQRHLAALAKRRRDMSLRHARIAAAMQSKVIEALAGLDARKLSPTVIAQWMQVAAQIERLALGEPSRLEVTGHDGGPIQTDVVTMTPEQRVARLDQLRREVERRIGQADASDDDSGSG